MITWFYFIVLVIAVVMTGSFLYKNKNVDTIFILFSILVTVNCLGRYMQACAESLETAIWANRLLYIGGCYAPLMTLLVMARLCTIKLPRPLVAFLTAYASVVLGFVMTIGYNGLYYASVEVVHGNGYNFLVKEYGPFHILYPIMMGMYSLILLWFMVYAIKRRQQISTRTVVTIGVIGSAVFLTYLLERLAGSKISYLSIGYLVGMLLLTKFFDRINMYDMSANIVSSIERMKEYGYIVVDNKYRFVSANENIKELFPEIRGWLVDKEIPSTDSYLYQKVFRGLVENAGEAGVSRTVSVQERYFQVDIRELSYGRKTQIGYLIEFIDRTAERNYYNTIEEYNTKLEKDVEEKTEHITYIKDMMVLGMADMVESRDRNTGGHIKRTSQVIRIFAEQLKKYEKQFKFSDKFLKQVVKAAPMHDLGKIAIDDAVLRKPGKYTEEEYAEMKRHAAEGARIVESILQGVEDDEFVCVARNVACYHHEKWNGTGYPSGKGETDIPLESRIMALADVFDALVSRRCYKEAFSYDEAFSIIEESLGQHFDPELGRIFMECRPELEAFYEGCK